MATLQADLDEMEATEPDVKAAAESYDAMVQSIVPKGRLTEIVSPPPGAPP